MQALVMTSIGLHYSNRTVQISPVKGTIPMHHIAPTIQEMPSTQSYDYHKRATA